MSFELITTKSLITLSYKIKRLPVFRGPFLLHAVLFAALIISFIIMNKIKPTPRFTTPKARVCIIEKFHWPYDEGMQDWPLEISDRIDLASCLKEYPYLIDDEKFLLMKGILYALDEVPEEHFELYSEKTVNFLKSDFEIHSYTIYYWACPRDNSDGFRITPFMREIWNSQ